LFLAMTLRPTLLASFLLLTSSAQIACASAPTPVMASANAAMDAAPSPSPPPATAAAGAAAPVAVAPTTPASKAKSATKERSPSLIFTGEMKMLADEDALPKTIDPKKIVLVEAGGDKEAFDRSTAMVTSAVASLEL